ncbi:MFS transporter [Kriegella aquimaris]|uniref:MFS transporter n=1 Tax=Kriegella aquimaris TaxID=192904 RepID=UPI00115F834A|nr:MFS transporter [Kriegella aquimaris]
MFCTVLLFQTSRVLLVVLVVNAIAIYVLILAPVFWVLVSEIFPNRIRGKAQVYSNPPYSDF